LFKSILLVSADSPDRLRPTDVDRVMDEAYQQGKFHEFKAWLLDQQLMGRTRELVESFMESDCTQ